MIKIVLTETQIKKLLQIISGNKSDSTNKQNVKNNKNERTRK